PWPCFGERLTRRRPRLGARFNARLWTRVGQSLARRLALHFANRFFEREALFGDVRFRQRRFDRTQLRDQGGTCPFVERAARLAGILGKAVHGSRNQRVIVRHLFSLHPTPVKFIRQPSNGLCIRIVSSRSGLVDRTATEQPINSSMRRTYLMACAGSCAQDRAPAVCSRQPSIVS